MFQINVLGVLRMTRAILPLMRDTQGSLINIGSVAGRVAYEGGAAYCGAKAAELQITRALRLELNGTGLRVSTIDPGMAETEFSMVRFKGDAEKAKKVYEGVEPLKAEDIAETLVWVASRPPHVCIDEMLIKCTDQAAIHKVHRANKRPKAHAPSSNARHRASRKRCDWSARSVGCRGASSACAARRSSATHPARRRVASNNWPRSSMYCRTRCACSPTCPYAHE